MDRFPVVDNILFSDEAHFYLNGHVNNHNCSYWWGENPKKKLQRLLHNQKVTVLAAMSASGIRGLFFEDHHGCAITVNSQRYMDMTRTLFTSALQELRHMVSTGWSYLPHSQFLCTRRSDAFSVFSKRRHSVNKKNIYKLQRNVMLIASVTMSKEGSIMQRRV